MTAAVPAPAGLDAGQPVTLRIAYRFFLPLVAMTVLNMVSKSAINAFLARTAHPSVALAAFSTSFTFYYTVTSVTEITALIAIGYLADRRAFRRIWSFQALVLAAPLGFIALVAFTPVGDWIYGDLFGASREAVREARIASLIFIASAPFLVMRGVAFGLLMLNRRTIIITSGAFVRLLSLGISLVVWPLLLSGAAFGAAALVTCMAFESIFVSSFAWRHLRELPVTRSEPVPGYGALWAFAWPLVLNQSAEMGVILIINVFLGRLDDPDLALAAFGVSYGLVSLMMSPMRNLAQTAQTLGRTRADARVLGRFALQLVAGLALVAAALFWTPASDVVLRGIMGLKPHIAAYCAPAMRIAFAMALVWALAALFRGLLAGRRTTRMLALTGGMRLAAAALAGSITLVHPGVNGAVLGLAAWIGAYAVESLVLGWRLRAGSAPRPTGSIREPGHTARK